MGLDFFTNYTPRLSITNAGLVGIGTQNPGRMLEVHPLMIAGFQESEFSEQTTRDPGLERLPPLSQWAAMTLAMTVLTKPELAASSRGAVRTLDLAATG